MDIIIEATNECQESFLIAFFSAQLQGPATGTWSSLCDEAKRQYEKDLLAQVRQAAEIAKLDPSVTQSELQEGQKMVLNNAKHRFDEVI